MGLFGWMFDATLVTCAAAGVRRATGISARDWLLPKVNSSSPLFLFFILLTFTAIPLTSLMRVFQKNLFAFSFVFSPSDVYSIDFKHRGSNFCCWVF